MKMPKLEGLESGRFFGKSPYLCGFQRWWTFGNHLDSFWTEYTKARVKIRISMERRE